MTNSVDLFDDDGKSSSREYASNPRMHSDSVYDLPAPVMVRNLLLTMGSSSLALMIMSCTTEKFAMKYW